MIKLQKVENSLSQSRNVSPNQRSKIQRMSQSSRKGYLPRVNPQFIGIGHELQRKRQQRRKVQQQQKAMAARVSFLQKQDQRTRKQLLSKRNKFLQIMSTKQRQQQQYQQKKMDWRRSQQEQLHRLKEHNKYMRMLHKSNLNDAVQSLHSRNHSEYARLKQRIKNDQTSKKFQKFQDLQEKRDKMISINISKQKGKMKVDRYYKSKNKQHLIEYKNRIKKEEETSIAKINSIRSLQSRENSLKSKLEHSTLRASRMEQLITKISRTIQTSNHNHQRHYKPAKETAFQSSLTQRDSAQGRHDYVEQNIELNDQIAQMQKEIKIVRKRRRNKHANRYKQYEQF